MQFTDEIPKVCKVVVVGCPISLMGGFGGDMRLGAVVLDLLSQGGFDVRRLTVENVGEYFSVVGDDVGDRGGLRTILVKQTKTPHWVK